jgi:N-acetylmuramic acid 6-phosphate etherase
MSRKIFDEISALTTESPHPRSLELDAWPTRRILELMSDEDAGVAAAVRAVLPEVEQAVEKVCAAFRSGGRLIYVGAGTSGRLGILDAAECPPTFGSDPDRVVGIIAGGKEAVFRSREGAEDDRLRGSEDLKPLGVTSKDVVFGITASRRTPYVLGALEAARRAGAVTVLLICNPPPGSGGDPPADIVIAPVPGPEVVMGSTRLKAGTATKMILNMVTTAAFIRSGKVYRGMMVDLHAGSEKLKERSKRVLMIAADLSYEEAEAVLERSGGSVKTALVMSLCRLNREQAEEALRRADGFVRRVIGK